MKSTLTPQQLLSFYIEVEKLKSTLRHSWLSNGIRQESVAEHTWMMALLALVVMPQLNQKLDQQKVLSMIIVHDLAESVTTDIPVWQAMKDKSGKEEGEKAAMAKILGHLDETTAGSLLKIWQEYEERKTPEALFVKALDTLDVIVQHDVAPTKSWSDQDYTWQLSPLQHAFFNFDEFLTRLKVEIDHWSIDKARQAGKLEKLDQVELKKRSEHE